MSKRDPVTNLYVPTANFKMPKTYKRMMCAITNASDRHHFKNMMVQAVLQSQDIPKKEKDKDKQS